MAIPDNAGLEGFGTDPGSSRTALGSGPDNDRGFPIAGADPQ